MMKVPVRDIPLGWPVAFVDALRPRGRRDHCEAVDMTIALNGLRTVIYPSPDLDAAKTWWTALLGIEPYFDQPFYVGYNIAGYELGLLPEGPPDGALTYWSVDDVATAVREAVALGATEHTPVADVGDGSVTATVRTPHGAILGLIFNPHFKSV